MIEPAQRGWVKCPPGELQRLGARLRVRRRRDFLFKLFVVLLATFGIGLGAYVTTALATRAADANRPGCHPEGECPSEAPPASVGGECTPK
jgi:hypothetical protein